MNDESIVMQGAVLAIVLAIGLVALTLVPKPVAADPSTALTAEQALDAVMRDARLAYPSAEISVLDSLTLPEGRHAARLKIAQNAHGPCPTVTLRSYELMPIFFREETVLKACTAGEGPLVYEEEALIKSLADANARRLADLGATGCAARAANLDKLSGVCQTARDALSAASPGLASDAWLVRWATPDESTVVSLGPRGELLG